VTTGVVRSVPIMGTIATIELVGTNPSSAPSADMDLAIDRAFEWFREVERVCNRFDPASELSQLTKAPGVPVTAGALLFATLDFALAIADDSGGAFDPTVGHQMERRGFNRDYRTGAAIDSGPMPDEPVSYRDVHLDQASRQVTVDRPLVLDLGGLAKGLAIDLAAQELRPYGHFAIDVGGDLYLAGHNAADSPWTVGVRHPRRDREAITRLRITDAAVCTSGDYERQSPDAGHHIIDPRAGGTAGELASVTVIAPTAMLADALATAAFVLGPVDGLRLLERHGVNGLLYTPTLDRYATTGLAEIEDRG